MDYSEAFLGPKTEHQVIFGANGKYLPILCSVRSSHLKQHLSHEITNIKPTLFPQIQPHQTFRMHTADDIDLLLCINRPACKITSWQADTASISFCPRNFFPAWMAPLPDNTNLNSTVWLEPRKTPEVGNISRLCQWKGMLELRECTTAFPATRNGWEFLPCGISLSHRPCSFSLQECKQLSLQCLCYVSAPLQFPEQGCCQEHGTGATGGAAPSRDLGSPILQGWCHYWRNNGGYLHCNLCKNGEIGFSGWWFPKTFRTVFRRDRASLWMYPEAFIHPSLPTSLPAIGQGLKLGGMSRSALLGQHK